MKSARELRLGNLINDVQSKEVIPVTIPILEEIDGGMDFYDPIPLSEEWLLKLGFEKNNDQFYCLYAGELKFEFKRRSFNPAEWEMELNTKGDDDISEPGKDIYGIKHIHQIQNVVFALTGTELPHPLRGRLQNRGN